jgi:hypothetical protein
MKSANFVVRAPMNKPDVVEVRYDCDCGCKPRARYQCGSSEAGHDQCCCGRVHFVGMDAQGGLETYLQEKGAGIEGAETHYTVSTEEVTASPLGRDRGRGLGRARQAPQALGPNPVNCDGLIGLAMGFHGSRWEVPGT